jgi:hypothetical protein
VLSVVLWQVVFGGNTFLGLTSAMAGLSVAVLVFVVLLATQKTGRFARL